VPGLTRRAAEAPKETLKYSAFPTAQRRAAKISGCKRLILAAIGKPRFSDGGRREIQDGFIQILP
jgi:hypothetical protein